MRVSRRMAMRQVPVGARIVDGPVGMPWCQSYCAFMVDCQSTYTGLVGYIRRAKVHSPGTMIVLRQREIVVFPRGVLPERVLRPEGADEQTARQ